MEDMKEFYMSTHFLLVEKLAHKTYNLQLLSYYREQMEPRTSSRLAKYCLADREELYLSTHFLMVDQLSLRTHNLQLLSYYREQVEPRRS